jgi:hypothetical protein
VDADVRGRGERVEDGVGDVLRGKAGGADLAAADDGPDGDLWCTGGGVS